MRKVGASGWDSPRIFQFAAFPAYSCLVAQYLLKANTSLAGSA